jgi:hypothetical protein
MWGKSPILMICPAAQVQHELRPLPQLSRHWDHGLPDEGRRIEVAQRMAGLSRRQMWSIRYDKTLSKSFCRVCWRLPIRDRLYMILIFATTDRNPLEHPKSNRNDTMPISPMPIRSILLYFVGSCSRYMWALPRRWSLTSTVAP